eukprot:648099-Lingulodinium_polyedra.AAC.1
MQPGRRVLAFCDIAPVGGQQRHYPPPPCSRRRNRSVVYGPATRAILCQRFEHPPRWPTDART